MTTGPPTSYFTGRAGDYSQLTAAPWQRLRHRIIIDTLARHLRPVHHHWLDAGGGEGTLAEHLAAQGHQVTLLEPAPDMLRAARRRLQAAGMAQRCRFVQATLAEAEPILRAEPHQGVSLHNVLEYTDDWRSSLAMCVAALPPGSLVSVVFSNIFGQLLAGAARGEDVGLLRERLETRTLTVGLAGSRFARPALLADEVEKSLAGLGVHVVGRYGVRTFNDIRAGRGGDDDFDEVLALELAVAGDPVLHQVARHIHLVGEKV
jgi:S-adenosylmethionine-dependent methyltransferase